MSGQKKFSCILFGTTSLLIRCGDLIKHRGHTITGVVSSDPAVCSWAEKNSIACIAPGEDPDGFLARDPFDVLFSIINPVILQPQILDLPRKYAINYHDALLPRYAGMHATSWALLNREPQHGVTWHIMEPGVDTGAVLKQRCVTVGERDTAFSLNLKCFEAAISSFTELLEELAAGREKRVAQKKDERSYFGKYRRPEAGCVLSWRRGHAEIDALVRALDFGYVENPVGVPKIAVENSFVIVSKSHIAGSSSGAAPGTIVACDDRSVQVATAGRDLVLDRLHELDGSLLPLHDFMTRYRLSTGARLPGLTPDTEHRLTALYSDTCRHEAYWAEQLLHASPVSLAAGRLLSPFCPQHRLASVLLQVPKPFVRLSEAAGGPDRCRQLIAAFAAYVSRVTEADDFALGYMHEQLSGRIDGLEAFFASCVPLVLKAGQQASFVNRMEQTAASVAEAERRITYPNDLFARYPWLEQAEPAVRQAAFPIAVSRVRSLDDYTAPPNSQCALVVSDDVRACRLVFDTSVFSRDFMYRMREQLCSFMQAVGDNPDRPVETLPLLTPGERQKIINEWNSTAADYDRGACIHRLFETQASRSPCNIATVFGGTALTYEELNKKANQIACHLHKKGVGPGALVGISLDRSHEMIIGLLAILKAGGAYVPLEPSFPRERLLSIVRTAGIGKILTQKKHAGLFAGADAVLIETDSEAETIAQENAGDGPLCAAAPDATAYVIFTSGSTGKPKGVVVAHRPVINLIQWAHRTFSFSEKDSVLFVTALSFDLSVFDVFGMLACGGTIHIVSDERRRDINYLVDMMLEGQITFWDSAPAALDMLVPALRSRQQLSDPALRLVFLSGDWIPLSLPDTIKRHFPRAEVVALGGATEATVWSNFFRFDEVDPAWKSIPYGRPIQNARYYILDRRLNPCPVGVAGDLYIGGECLSSGYLNEPELTAQSFLHDPFADLPDARMYRTGDRARFYPDGTIEFLGRKDFQVKIRGYRIELGEVEYALRSHRGVADAVAAVRKDRAGDQKLVAYVVPRREALTTAKGLKAHVRDFLPDYMIPNSIGFVDALPLTANGKIDRNALPWPVPAPAARTAGSDQSGPHSENAKRETVLSVIRQVLQTEDIGPGDDMFDFGVTSLNLIQIAEMLKERFGAAVSAETFLDAPTATGIAARLGSGKADDAPRPCCEMPGEIRGREPELAVSAKAGTGTQEVLSVIRQVLQTEDIGPDDDMFDFGVTSLNLIQIAEMLKERFGAAVSAETFLDAPTAAGIAARLQPAAPAAVSSPAARHTAAPPPASIPLEHTLLNRNAYVFRASNRTFSPGGLSRKSVGRLLHLLHQKEINGEKKYLYPSAGGLNAVQTYLYAHKGRIERIPHGIYYYHPVEHALYRITGDPDISPAIHFPSNRDSFDAAAFSVYFIAQLDAIEPVYTVMSRELVTLDAGYMTQLLQSRQEDMGVRLCPVSGVDFESIRHFFRLSPAHMFVQCLLGGPADSSARRAQAEDIETYIKATGRKIHAHFREADGDRTYLDTGRIVQFERLNALSEEEHVLLHRRRLHLRTFTNGAVGLKLPRGRIDDAEYILRSTQRSYENRTVPFASFSRFMKLLGQESIDGKARRLYPSISATYAVHVYAYVKENGVENVASGIYRYDPVEHSLQAVTVRPACDIKAAHFPGNRSYYNQSKFSLFLIADLEKLRPSFGEEALHLVTLEAGCIGQLLLDRQAEFDMGVCSIGGMRFDKVRDDFKLSRGQMLVHSFVCGPVSRLLTVPAHRKLMPPAAPLKHGMLSHWLRGLRL